MKDNTTRVHIEFIMRIFIIVGGLSHLAFGMGYKHAIRNKMLSLVIGICAVSLAFRRDFYLPFLGQTVVPLLNESHQVALGASKTTVQLKGLPPKSRVIFWAAMPGKDTLSNPMEAYADYSNSGAAMSDANGNASLQLNCPMQYKVHNKTLYKHLHYRFEDPKMKGMFSRVYTKKMDC